MSTASKAAKYEKEALLRQKRSVQDAAFQELLDLRTQNGGSTVKNDIHRITTKYSASGLLNRQHLHYRWRKYVQGTDPRVQRDVLLPDPNVAPSGTNQDQKQLCKKLTEKAAVLFKEKRNTAAKNGTIVERNCLKNIIAKLEHSNHLPPHTLQYETIRKRAYTNNTSGKRASSIPPLQDVEYLLARSVMAFTEIGRNMTKELFMDIASRVIKDTPHETALRQCKRQRLCPDSLDENGNVQLGEGWYRGFMKRHKHMIEEEHSIVTTISNKK